MQALFRFVTGSDVISSIVGWRPQQPIKFDEHPRIVPRFLVLAAEEDVLCTPSILKDAAERYRAAFHQCVRAEKLDGVSESDLRIEIGEHTDWDGVDFKVAKGLGHHLQNHVEWDKGAQEVLRWVQQL